jgi:AcrR family transcriptional regulator
MPAPRKFTAEQLRDAALAIVDADGLDALTMRSLATRLGTGPMTIYNYVAGRDGLDALVVSAVLAGAPPPEPSDDWRADLRTLAFAFWRAAETHPNVVPLLLARRTTDEPTMAGAEALLAALRRGGFGGFRLLTAFRAVSGFVAGFAQTTLDGPLDRARALPAEHYPGLREIAEATDPDDRETEFSAALDIVLAGLAPQGRDPRDRGSVRRRAR